MAPRILTVTADWLRLDLDRRGQSGPRGEITRASLEPGTLSVDWSDPSSGTNEISGHELERMLDCCFLARQTDVARVDLSLDHTSAVDLLLEVTGAHDSGIGIPTIGTLGADGFAAAR